MVLLSYLRQGGIQWQLQSRKGFLLAVAPIFHPGFLCSVFTSRPLTAVSGLDGEGHAALPASEVPRECMIGVIPLLMNIPPHTTYICEGVPYRLPAQYLVPLCT